MGALSHLKVLDLSRVLAGPWASQILADLGAEVIKIERPGVGDDTRAWGPPFMPDADGSPTCESAYFLSTNRGKKSVCVDLKSLEGQRTLQALARNCDVVIENFKVGDADRYGLGYSDLSKINNALVYCSITGFGQNGPMQHRPGYDFMIQAMAGLMSITGAPDEEAGGGPQKVGVALTDIMTGLYATIGILAALAERERSGLGQHVDMALFDVTAASLANQASNYLVGGIDPTRLGNAHPNIVPYQSFVVADGHIVVAVGNDSQFR
ncbi:MAG: CaiB/BaiF CoA-transferase family protein, partial [Pseudomonadota bacterium]